MSTEQIKELKAGRYRENTKNSYHDFYFEA